MDCSAMAPGLWRLALPFPSPLGFSYSYLVRVADGFVAVDTGWDCDEGWDLFQRGLARAGGLLTDLRGVVVTHAHPDHYGLTARIQDQSEAWVGMHPGELALLAIGPDDAKHHVERLVAWFALCGVPTETVEEVLLADRRHLLGDFSGNPPNVELHDGQPIPGTDGALVAIHTPGHTPGHLVFHDRERDVVFTGDHLLPRVSANISLRPTSTADPLGDYHASLDKLEAHRDALAAPGHEWTFDRVGERVDAVRAHHDMRLDEVVSVVASGARTPWDVAQRLSWSRPFATLNARGKRSALGEAAAHLVRLEASRRLTRESVNRATWTFRVPNT